MSSNKLTEKEEKYNIFLSNLYKELKDEEIAEASMFEDEELLPAFEKTILKPDLSLKFPHKDLLKKEEKGILYKLYSYAGPGLSMAALLLLALLMQSQLPATNISTGKVHSDEKIMPDFPVMEAPLTSSDNSALEINYTTSPSGKIDIREISIVKRSKSDANQKSAFPGLSRNITLENLSKQQLDNALELLHNRTMAYASAEISIPASEDYIRSKLNLPSGLQQAETRIFLENPLGITSGRLIQKPLSRHTIDNLNKDNIYSVRLSLAKW
jgi:hypothetical protein